MIDLTNSYVCGLGGCNCCNFGSDECECSIDQNYQLMSYSVRADSLNLVLPLKNPRKRPLEPALLNVRYHVVSDVVLN